MGIQEKIKKDYLEFLQKVKQVLNGTFQFSEGKPLFPEKEIFDIDHEAETFTNKVVRQIVNEIPKEIFSLNEIENYIVFNGTEKEQMRYRKEKLDCEISDKLNGLISVAKTESEPLTTSKKQILGIMVQSGIVDFLRTKYNANDNQISRFIETITKSEIKQKTAYNGIVTTHKDYALQNIQDEREADDVLKKIFRS